MNMTSLGPPPAAEPGSSPGQDQTRAERYAQILQSLSEGFGLVEVVVDARGRPADFRLLEVNEPFARLVGFPPEEAYGKRAREVVPGLGLHGLEILAKVADTGTPARFESYVRGAGKWYEVSAYRSTPGQIAFLLIDITERKQAEEAAVGQLKLAEAVFTRSISPLVLLDRHYNFLRVNEAYARACGKSVGDFVGRNHFEMYPSDTRLIFDEVLRTKRPYTVLARPFVFPDRPDRVTYWDWTLVPVLDREGEVESLVFSLIEVTERKVAEDALRESEQRYRAQAAELELIYRMAPIGLCVLDTELRYIHINERLAEINSVPAAEHLGRTVREVLPVIADQVEPMLRCVVESGEPAVEVEGSIEVEPGVVREWNSQYWPMKTADGRVYAISVVVEEITERRRLAEARQREQEFRSLAENSSDIISRFDKDLRRVYVNQAIESILECPRAELIGKTHREIGLPEPVAETLDRELIKVFETRRPHEAQVVVPTPRGERYLDARLIPEFNRDGEVVTVLTITRDLTERKIAEDALQESEQKYRALVEHLYEGIWLLDSEARTAYANARLGELLDYAPEDMLGKSWFDFMHPRCVDEARAYLERGKTAGRAEYDFEFLRRDGEALWAHIAATPLFDETDAHYEGVLAGVIDVTDRKRAEDALRQREREFTALVERAPDIIARIDRSLRLRYINPAVERITGQPREWFLGKTPAERELSPEEAAKLEQTLKQVFETGQELVVEHKNSTLQGERYYQMRLVPEFGPDNTVESVLVVERDIEDLKRAQQALEEQTLVDPLTGIANRRFLERFAGREWSREARHHLPIAAIMIDIDHFKAYNDRYGHAQGDECLRQVAITLRESLLRPADTIVRYGGEEFVVLLPESDLAAARDIAERMRLAVAERIVLPPVAEAGEHVSVSLGVAAVHAHEGKFEELIKAADAALYRAKKNGRNRVEIYNA